MRNSSIAIGSGGQVERFDFAFHSAASTLSRDAAATNTTIFVRNADGLAVGQWWDVGSRIERIAPTNRGDFEITLSGSIGSALTANTAVTFNPLAGANQTLTIPSILQPVNIFAWGYLGNDVFSSAGRYASLENFHYQVVSGNAFRVGSFAANNETAGIARIGAAIRSTGGATYYEMLYRPATNELSFAARGGETRPLYLFSVVLSS